MITFSIAKPCADYLAKHGRNLTDTEIAEAVKTSRPTVKNAKTGELRKIDLDMVGEYLAYFRGLGVNVQLSDLIKEGE